MYIRSKRIISKLLLLVMLATTVLGFNGLNVQAGSTTNSRTMDVWDWGGVEAGSGYTSQISVSALNGLKAAGNIVNGVFAKTTAFGDLTVVTSGAHYRLYYKDGATNGVSSYGSPSVKTFSDGYANNGSLYIPGNDDGTNHYIKLDHVEAGDVIQVYGYYTNSGSGTPVFNFALTNASGVTTTKASEAIPASGEIFRYRALESGTLKIIAGGVSSGIKPNIARITRTPGVKVSGALNLNGYTLSGYSLVFQNQTTSDILRATLNPDNTFDVTLNAGDTYTAVLQGVSSDYSISDSTKTVVTSVSDITNGIGNITLDVSKLAMATVGGHITGFDPGYDRSNFKITFQPPEGSLAPAVQASIDQTAMTYTADVRAGAPYTTVISGVNDYELTGGTAVNISSDTVQDITVAPKATYAVNGSFVGLPAGVTVSSIRFKHMTDSYMYDGTVTPEGGYTASLRDGAYAVSAVVSDASYSTIGHVVVSGGAASKDVKFSSSAAPAALPWVGDLYVGDSTKANNYATVKEALAAAARMKPSSEAQRITIHIAPGTYRAQLIISTPYISLVNADPSKEVKITWYYGVGYDYYSADSTGVYNEDRAFDKYAKGFAGNFKWGATVFLTSAAAGFKAENIVFENSFNKYLTQEELEDGVQVTTTSTPTNQTARVPGLDVTSRGATERAAAMGVEADNVEFLNCSFLSSQDTLYTGNSITNQYYKNCFIEGNTDYIFGDGNLVFDNCTLNFTGYSDQGVGGYITAAKPSNASSPLFYGYLFRDCIVTGTVGKVQAPGYFGRPWGQDAKVRFLDTKLKDNLITPEGWASMSNSTPEKANFYEYNTTYNGAPVDTAARKGKLLAGDAAITNVTQYFGSDWTPKYYTPSSVSAPVLSVSSISQSQALLNWQPSTSTMGSVLYAVYANGTKVGTTTETAYTVSGLAPATGYTFQVTAANTAGDTASSAQVAAATSNTASAPLAPVITAAPGDRSATISWSTVTDATYYTVKGRTVTGSVYNMVYTVTNPTVTSYTYSNLMNGTAYQFVLTASNAYGESPASNAVTVTPAASGSGTGSGAVPSAPSISGTAGGTSATITWSAVPGAASYTVKGGKSPGSYPMVYTVNSGTVTSYTYTGLTYGTSYSFIVTASNASGESLSSNIVTVTPGQNARIKPEDFVGADVGDVAIKGSSSFDDDSNTFTLTGAGTGVNKNATGSDQFYFMGVKMKGDYTITAKANFTSYGPGVYGSVGLTVRESLDTNSYHYTQLEQYSSTAVGGRKLFRYNGSSNGSNSNLALTGTAYLKIIKVGDKITSIISSSPIPDNPVASDTLIISTTDAKNLGLDANGNQKELYVGLLATSASASRSITGTFEDIRIVMADGTVAFDSNDGKPVAPKNVTTKPFDKSVQITWDALATATSYTVKQSTGAQGPFTAVQTVTGSVYQTVVNGLENDKTYYFVVTAGNDSGEGPASKVVSAVPTASALVPPVITMTSAAPANDVYTALLPLSGSVDKRSTITITNNGSLIKLDGTNTSLVLEPNATFRPTLVLVAGLNEIVIKAVDMYGNVTTLSYNVTYTYKAASVHFLDADGNAVTSLTGGTDIVVKAEVENYVAPTKDAVLVVGLYDEHNNLIKFIMTAEALSDGETEVFYARIKLPDDVSGYTLKAYIWDNAGTMHPVSDVTVLQEG